MYFDRWNWNRSVDYYLNFFLKTFWIDKTLDILRQEEKKSLETGLLKSEANNGEAISTIHLKAKEGI